MARSPRRNNVAELEPRISRVPALDLRESPSAADGRHARAKVERLVRADRSFPAFREENISFLEERFKIDIDDDGAVSGNVGAQPLTVRPRRRV